MQHRRGVLERGKSQGGSAAHGDTVTARSKHGIEAGGVANRAECRSGGLSTQGVFVAGCDCCELFDGQTNWRKIVVLVAWRKLINSCSVIFPVCLSMSWSLASENSPNTFVPIYS